MSLRVRFGIFGADDASLDQATDIRVIAGEAGDAVGANQVEAAVANMGKVEQAIDYRQSSTGGSHAVEFRMVQGEALNILMCGFESRDERALRIAAKGVVIDAAHGFYGQATGLLSALVSTHAVGHDGETALAAEVLVGVGFPVEVGVFVIGALTADVGEARRFDAGLWSFHVNGHR